MNLEPVVDYLEANNVGIKGKNLFAQYLPQSVEEGVVVIANSPIRVHPYQKGRRDGTIQIIVRGKDYSSIEAKANQISDLLHVEGLNLLNCKVLSVIPQHDPLFYPRAEGSLLEASINFNIVFIN